MSKRKKCLIAAVVFIVVLIIAAAAGASLGAMRIGFRESIMVIMSNISGQDYGLPKNITAVIWDIRLPRIICAIFAGAGLAAAGVCFQALLQNPLADPYTLGVSTGASFGASLALWLNMALGVSLPVSVFALVSAFITLMAVISVSKAGGGLESSNLIISGMIISSALSAGVSLIKMLAGENVGAIVYWMMGSLVSKTWSDAALLVPCVTVGCIIIWTISRELNIMALGEKTAAVLGVHVKKIRLIALVTGAAITAVCVSTCGIIGFVGLIIPHGLRFAVSSDNKVLLPLSALGGGALLCFADNCARIISNVEIPVGVLTSIIGAPFFLWVFRNRRRTL